MAEAGAAQGKKHLQHLGQTWQNTLDKAQQTAGQQPAEPSDDTDTGKDS